MNKYIFGTISSAILGLILVSCNSGDDYNIAPPRAFPDLAMGKCDTDNVTLDPTIYKTQKEQSIEFNTRLGTSLKYWEYESNSYNRFIADTEDNPGGWNHSLILHAKDCTLGPIENYNDVTNVNGLLNGALMIFSSCQPKLESRPVTRTSSVSAESSQLTLDFKAAYRIESPEEYNAESPVILRSGTIHFRCPYILQDRGGNPIPTNSHSIVTAK